jgi:hypothetical protein
VGKIKQVDGREFYASLIFFRWIPQKAALFKKTAEIRAAGIHIASEPVCQLQPSQAG